MRPRRQPVEEICHVNGVSVQRYEGVDPRDTKPWSPWDPRPDHDPPKCEMITLFYSGGAKIDMSLAAFECIVEKWLAYAAGEVVP